MRTNLYRHFDKNGALLYVGISVNAVARIKGNQAVKPWFYDIVDVKIETFDTRILALEAEAVAIRMEAPLHNIIHNTPAKVASVKERPPKKIRVRISKPKALQPGWRKRRSSMSFSLTLRRSLAVDLSCQLARYSQ